MSNQIANGIRLTEQIDHLAHILEKIKEVREALFIIEGLSDNVKDIDEDIIAKEQILATFRKACDVIITTAQDIT